MKYLQQLSNSPILSLSLKKSHKSKHTASKQQPHKSTLNDAANLLQDICYF